ncbi:molecular chaperone [Pseudomonas sp. DTU_2021_1001937_2_SI_NGA_ILE_001]|uniref:fimbrial biogenesis chaperone n=1 Tax=Pseudomonas sp. DTU_2021_1001937_2_SI_NGA_ILE_001 TaxID=3077589 RepID=UPI0025E479FB|nr:molecular chaperone [Pseudomonas sp. DTU_2021_1001937_2_SI_NGA_ILE_001]WNW10762.1 molecular chaperone [Pseudomonas sp. DTU_2021_1001937_2_SI_NGA_ILE_001]
MPGFFKPATVLQGACLAMALAFAPASQAALTLSTTRVVFDGERRSASLIVSNPSNRPFAVQTWVNTAADDAVTPVPFMPSPALFRLDPGKEQQVQINGLPHDLPGDHESLFYFNVQEIPQASGDQGNLLNIALRTRIKLFYRPAGLRDNPVKRLPELRWSVEQQAGKTLLVAHNPTPFHVSFSRLEVSQGQQNERVKNPRMLAPLHSQSYPLGTLRPAAGLKVTWSAINDYGGQTSPLSQDVHVSP